MHLSNVLSLRLQQAVALTQEQRLLIQTRMVQIRLDLHDAVYERRFEPKADCPQCGRQLTVIEILKGFTSDPADVTTLCPSCKHRFPAQLHALLSHVSSMRVSFFCPSQTIARLRGFEHFNFEEIKRKDPSILYSALIHFGTLQNAFRQVGVDYAEDPKPQSWQERIESFLGQISDRDIAEIVGVRRSDIAVLRRRRNIHAFRRRDLLAA